MNFVLDVALKATLLLALGHLLIVAGRRLSAGNRHIIAAAFLVATALLPVLSLTMPKRTLALLPNQTPITDRLTDAAAAFLTNDVAPMVLPIEEGQASAAPQTWGGDVVVGDVDVVGGVVDDAMVTASADTVTMSISSPMAVTPVDTTALPFSFEWANLGLLLFSVWFAGALLVAGRLVVGIGRVVWIRTRASEAPVVVENLVLDVAARFGVASPAVFVSESADVPFVCGMRRPAIIMPRQSLEWDRARLSAVITHEMAHVKRRDCYTLILGRLTVALHWFNPLAWALEKESRRLCERACDDVVLRYGEAPSDYASHILEIARGLPDHDNLTSVALAVSRKSEIEGRLMAILHPSIGRQVVSARAAVVLCGTVLVLAMAAATFTLGAAPADQIDEVDALRPDATITVTPSGASSNSNSNSNENTSSDDEECCGWIEPDPYGAYSKKERQKNGSNYYDIAWDYHRNDDYAQAAQNFVQAAAWGYRPGTSMYNAACGYALSGQEGLAVRALERAVAKGWDDASHTRSDSDLKSLRGTSEFAAIVRRMEDECDCDKKDHDNWEVKVDGGDDKYRLSSEIQAKLEIAMTELEEHGKVESLDVDDLNEIAYRLMNRGEYELGFPMLEEAIRKSDRRSTRALYNMACIRALRGEADEALSWLSKAIDQGLDRVDLLNEDKDLDRIRDDKRFAALVDKAEDLSLASVGGHGWGKDDRARAWKEAAADWSRYLRSHPRSGRAWSNLGFAHYKLKEVEEAEKAFLRAYQFDYQPGATAYNIASTLALRNKDDEAFHWLEKADSAGFNVGSRLFDDDDVRHLRRDPRAERYSGKYRDLAERSEREVARAYQVTWGDNGSVEVRGANGSFAVARGSESKPEAMVAVESAQARSRAVVAGASMPTVSASSSAGWAVVAEVPPLPPLPPLPPTGANRWSVGGMVLVRGKSMIVNTYDDYNLSANRTGKKTYVNLDGRKLTFDTDHLFIYPILGKMHYTEDHDVVEEALDIIDEKGKESDWNRARNEIRDIDREIKKLERNYQSLTRKHEQIVRKMDRVKRDEERRELISEIDEIRDDQSDILREIGEEMEERESLIEEASVEHERLVEERAERIERLVELMEDAIENGKAKPIR